MWRNMETDHIRNTMRKFVSERDWDQFHSPKNLAMALSVEVAELLEHFQWLGEQESHTLDSEKRQQVSYEMIDVLIYLVRLSDKLDIDLNLAFTEKMKINAEKYPVEKVKGSARKYTEYTNKGDD